MKFTVLPMDSCLKYHARIALGYFMIAAFLGVLLRGFQAGLFGFNYRFFVHTHSHIALLGWVYLAITALIYKVHLLHTGIDRRYRRLFRVTQLSLLGMLLSFPLQGYALFSIFFSTLFLIISYVFTWLYLAYAPHEIKSSQSFRLLRAALFYMVLSSLGPWALGVIMNTLGPASVWYRIAVYFYLHFQYNGWMFLGLLGLLFTVAEQHGLQLQNRTFVWFFNLLNVGILLSFFLSVLWANPVDILYWIAGLGALLQCLAVIMVMVFAIRRKREFRKLFTGIQLKLIAAAGCLLFVKVFLQVLTAIPYFAGLAVRILDFTIAYLHLTFLGVISLTLFALLDYYKLLAIPRRALWVYLLGFALSEFLILYKAITAWWGLETFFGFQALLAMTSLAIPLGLIGWFIPHATQKS